MGSITGMNTERLLRNAFVLRDADILARIAQRADLTDRVRTVKRGMTRSPRYQVQGRCYDTMNRARIVASPWVKSPEEALRRFVETMTRKGLVMELVFSPVMCEETDEKTAPLSDGKVSYQEIPYPEMARKLRALGVRFPA